MIDRSANKVLLEIDPQFYRPGEVPFLKGSSEKIEKTLGWKPRIMWQETLSEMLDYDLKLAKLEA